MFQKKKQEIQRPVVQQSEEIEEEYEAQEEPVLKKKEVSIEPKEEVEQAEEPTEDELTEEAVKQILTNLTYRIGRIEHHLRLDF